MSSLSDREIVERMRRGDVTGLEALLRQYGPGVKAWLSVGFALRFDDHLLEDAAHDASLILFRRAKKLDPNNNLSGYFYRTASRELVRSVRRRNRDLHRSSDAIDHLAVVPTSAPAGPFAKALAAHLRTFPEKEREIISMDAASDYSMPATEIAKAIGTTRATVYTLRNRTKTRLQQFLSEWQDAAARKDTQGGRDAAQ